MASCYYSRRHRMNFKKGYARFQSSLHNIRKESEQRTVSAYYGVHGEEAGTLSGSLRATSQCSRFLSKTTCSLRSTRLAHERCLGAGLPWIQTPGLIMSFYMYFPVATNVQLSVFSFNQSIILGIMTWRCVGESVLSQNCAGARSS